MLKEEYKQLPGAASSPHSVQIENRERISLTGVQAVDSFNEREVLIKTDAGDVTVFGSGLHITKLDLDAGHLWISGLIIGMEYMQTQKQGLLSRLFG